MKQIIIEEMNHGYSASDYPHPYVRLLDNQYSVRQLNVIVRLSEDNQATSRHLIQESFVPALNGFFSVVSEVASADSHTFVCVPDDLFPVDHSTELDIVVDELSCRVEFCLEECSIPYEIEYVVRPEPNNK